MKNYKIAVAGTGYVGLSLSVLLAQHNQVMAVDIVQAKVDMINNHKSPIQDDYIEKYLAEKELNLIATLDAKAAYSDADFVVIAAPTNVYSTAVSDVNDKLMDFCCFLLFSAISMILLKKLCQFCATRVKSSAFCISI